MAFEDCVWRSGVRARTGCVSHSVSKRWRLHPAVSPAWRGPGAGAVLPSWCSCADRLRTAGFHGPQCGGLRPLVLWCLCVTVCGKVAQNSGWPDLFLGNWKIFMLKGILLRVTARNPRVFCLFVFNLTSVCKHSLDGYSELLEMFLW